MNLYLAYPKYLTNRENLDSVTQFVQQLWNCKVTESSSFDWDSLTKEHKYFEVACVMVVSQFDTVVVVEDSNGFIGRGLLAQLRFADEMEIPRFVVRWEQSLGEYRAYQIAEVKIVSETEWHYCAVIRAGERIT